MDLPLGGLDVASSRGRKEARRRKGDQQGRQRGSALGPVVDCMVIVKGPSKSPVPRGWLWVQLVLAIILVFVFICPTTTLFEALPLIPRAVVFLISISFWCYFKT